MKRRDILKLAALAPLAASFSWTESEAAVALDLARKDRSERGASAYEPKFFTAHEYATVLMLVDIIIPRDERSGGASDAGVPEFMDFMMTDPTTSATGLQERQIAMRGGLAWLDAEMRDRYGKAFIEASDAQRAELLDIIAYPRSAPPEIGHGVAFFNSFRDLTANGFFTSKMGIEDLQYRGNVFVGEWTGCPEECYHHLGVKKA